MGMYVVAGSASQTSKGRVNHKAMRFSSKSKGSALLSIMGNSKARIDFVTEDGQVKDVVELHKSARTVCLEDLSGTALREGNGLFCHGGLSPFSYKDGPMTCNYLRTCLRCA